MEFLGAVDLLLKAADAISGKRAYRKRKRDQLYSPTKASSAKVALKALRQPVVETMALESTMAAESGGSSYTSPPPQPSSSVPATPPKPIIVIHVGFHTAVRFSITGKWATFSSVLQLLRGAPLQSPASFLQLSASWRARNPGGGGLGVITELIPVVESEEVIRVCRLLSCEIEARELLFDLVDME